MHRDSETGIITLQKMASTVAISEEKKIALDDVKTVKDDTLVLDAEDKAAPQHEETDDHKIIITGADAAKHLLPLRDDGEPALTFRSLFLASVLAAFQAVMSEIYYVSWPFCFLCKSISNLTSSNQPLSPSKGLLSSLSPTFSARRGRPFYRVAIGTRRAGGRKVARESFPDGSRSSRFSIQGLGV